ncbi:MAG: 6-bladed beta-propeller [Balneolales bacterium]|nr:6-bladed beta-propeller [Balneolales bacterium]
MQDLVEIPIISLIEIPLENHDIYLPQHPLRDKYGNFVLVNQPRGGETCLYLLGPKGEFYAKNGREGRGPGEFGSINHIELTPENDLYVLDLMNSKIIRFKVLERNIEFVGETALNLAKLSGHYRSVHHINGKNWAVLAGSGFRKDLTLVELDDNFLPVREHLHIPNHFPDIHFSQSQMFTNGGWFSDSKSFNYFLYDSLVVYSYNVKSEVLERIELNEPHSNRPQTDMSREFISKKFGRVDNITLPGVSPQTKPSSTYELIQMRSIARDGNIMVGAIQYYGGDNTFVLIHNFESNETNHLRAPRDFTIQSISGSVILGFEVRMEEPNKLLVLEF